MRRWVWSVLLMIAVMAALTVGASAEDTIVNHEGIRYNLTTGTVLGPVNKDNVVSITIRSSVNGSIIKSIAADAFNGCGKLTTVHMESGLETLGASAFNSCTLLQTIVLPDSVKDIGNYAFANCGRLNNVVLPTILTDIKTGTFANCSSLKSIYIATVSHIYPSAFSGSGVTALHRDTDAGLKQDDAPELPIHVTTRVPGLKTDPTCVLQGSQLYSYNCTAGCGAKFNFSQSQPIPALGHDPGEEIPEVPSTCSKDGTTAGHRCNRCKGIADGVTRIPKDPTDPTKHNATLVKIPGRAATCTEPGLEEGEQCPDCGTMVKEQKELPMAAHQYANKTIIIREATCTKEGLQGTFEVCSVCEAVKECSECENLKDDPTKSEDYEKHIMDDHSGSLIDKKDHTPGAPAYVVTTQPTCTDKGQEEWKVVCSVCKEGYEDAPDTLDHLPREVPPLGHDIVGGIETITKQPTCTEAGEKTISKQACKREGCTYTKEEQTGVRVDPLGHDLTDPVDKKNVLKATCKEDGEDWLNFRECKRQGCDYEEKTVVKTKGAHNWTNPKPDESKADQDKEASCGEAGVSHVIVTCSACGREEAQAIPVPATNSHTWGEWTVTKQPTATEAGEQTRTCSVCNKTDTVPVSPTGTPSKPDDPDNPDGSEKPDDTEKPASYRVDLVQGSNGSITSNKSTAQSGDRVTLTVWANSGYELDMIRAVSANGGVPELSDLGGGQYRFTMPASNVEIRVTFTPLSGRSGSGWAGSPGSGSSNTNPRRTTDVMPTQNPVQSTPQAGAYSQIFRDIPTSHWAAGEINWANQMGFMNGSNGRFNPDGNITHQQMWMVLARLTGSHPASMAEARRWAVEGSFADGSSPTSPVSRHQLVTALDRCAHLMGSTNRNSTSLAGYADSRTVPAGARDAFSWAVANGIVGGTANGRLDPNGTLTRAQFAVILYRYSQRI